MAYAMEIKDEAKAELRALLKDLHREIGYRLHQLQQNFAGVVKKLRDTWEDLEDRLELARAQKRNAGKAGTAWESVKNESNFDF